ncbi:MAG: ABC transporter permease, partial [Chlorobi bacterium]|nr:ABC transporter permease [Chlorobiota bacterium]NOG68735.1 ABC transporter permease [Chlorobiota bacterium]
VGKLAQVAIGQVFPDIPFTAPWWAVLAAPLTAVATSVLFTVLPAKRAAQLDPVQALSKR